MLWARYIVSCNPVYLQDMSGCLLSTLVISIKGHFPSQQLPQMALQSALCPTRCISKLPFRAFQTAWQAFCCTIFLGLQKHCPGLWFSVTFLTFVLLSTFTYCWFWHIQEPNFSRVWEGFRGILWLKQKRKILFGDSKLTWGQPLIPSLRQCCYTSWLSAHFWSITEEKIFKKFAAGAEHFLMYMPW